MLTQDNVPHPHFLYTWLTVSQVVYFLNMERKINFTVG